MKISNLIQRIGDRIEELDTAIFSGPLSLWRYPACIVRQVKVDRSDNNLWFKMKNISLDDEPGQKAPALLFCYNKHLNFYISVEGEAAIAGLAGDVGAREGWQDPLLAHQITYLIRMEVRDAITWYRPSLPEVAAFNPTMPMPGHFMPAPDGKAGPFPDRPYVPPIFTKKSSKIGWSSIGWSSFLTGLY